MKGAIWLVVLSTVLTTAAQLFYKSGAARLPELVSNWPLIAGFVLYCFAALLIIWALRFVELSIVFPLLATSFVWVSLISVFFFGESLSVINWFGVFFIACGVAVVGWRR
jgi:drug/metabolite transporter (DMT)-like permease